MVKPETLALVQYSDASLSYSSGVVMLRFRKGTSSQAKKALLKHKAEVVSFLKLNPTAEQLELLETLEGLGQQWGNEIALYKSGQIDERFPADIVADYRQVLRGRIEEIIRILGHQNNKLLDESSFFMAYRHHFQKTLDQLQIPAYEA